MPTQLCIAVLKNTILLKKEKKRFLQKIEQEFQFKLAKQNFDYFAKNPLLFYQTFVKSRFYFDSSFNLHFKQFRNVKQTLKFEAVQTAS